MDTWLENLRSRGLGRRALVLGLVTLAMYAVVAPVAGCLGGQAAIWAATVAAGLCLAGTGSALVASHFLRGTKRALCGMLVGTMLRMGIPLIFGLGCHLHGGFLAQAGLLYYLLVFYPVTLAVETVLSLPLVDQRGHGPNASRGVVL
jgi:hypothetical protein